MVFYHKVYIWSIREFTQDTDMLIIHAIYGGAPLLELATYTSTGITEVHEMICKRIEC